MARTILNHAVIHVTGKDKAMKDWHKKIKKRKGSKIARVAVMRKLATIIWHILKRQTTYQFHDDPIAMVTQKTTSHKKSRSGFLRHDNNAVVANDHHKTKMPSPPRGQAKANGP